MMKSVIISEKNRKKEENSIKKNADKITLVKVIKTSSLVDLNDRYMQAISNIDINVAKNLGLTNIKKY